MAAAAIGTTVVTPAVAPASPISSLFDQTGRHDVASAYVGYWTTPREGLSIDFAPNGYARVGRFSNVHMMPTEEKWAARWAPAGRDVVLSFTRPIGRPSFIRGLGVWPGTRWTGRIVKLRGKDRLIIDQRPGVRFCRSTDQLCT